MDGYVSKPIKPEELFKTIEDLNILEHKELKKEAPSSATDQLISGPLLDLEASMETVGGDKDLFKEIATLLIESMPDLLEEIRQGISSGDAGAVERSAHGLKGALGNFGKGQAYKAAFSLEKIGNSGGLTGAEKAIEELEVICATLEKEIMAALNI